MRCKYFYDVTRMLYKISHLSLNCNNYDTIYNASIALLIYIYTNNVASLDRGNT